MFSDKIFSLELLKLSKDALMQLLLYGDQDLSNDLNRNLLELTVLYVSQNRLAWL